MTADGAGRGGLICDSQFTFDETKRKREGCRRETLLAGENIHESTLQTGETRQHTRRGTCKQGNTTTQHGGHERLELEAGNETATRKQEIQINYKKGN